MIIIRQQQKRKAKTSQVKKNKSKQTQSKMDNNSKLNEKPAHGIAQCQLSAKQVSGIGLIKIHVAGARMTNMNWKDEKENSYKRQKV